LVVFVGRKMAGGDGDLQHRWRLDGKRVALDTMLENVMSWENDTYPSGGIGYVLYEIGKKTMRGVYRIVYIYEWSTTPYRMYLKTNSNTWHRLIC
jgi:hypothetical protein